MLKNFITTLLICFVGCNLIQGEIIRGKVIPKTNMTAILGRWYLTASTLVRDQNACSTFTVARQSTDKWTINIYSQPRQGIFNQTSSNTSQNITLNVNFRNGSNVIFTTNEQGDGPCMVIFEMVPDSYMAIHMTLSKDNVTSGRDGNVCIFTRQKKLPCEIFERVKESIFYEEGVHHKSKMINIDSSTCE